MRKVKLRLVVKEIRDEDGEVIRRVGHYEAIPFVELTEKERREVLGQLVSRVKPGRKVWRPVFDADQYEARRFDRYQVHPGAVFRCKCGVITDQLALCVFCTAGYVPVDWGTGDYYALYGDRSYMHHFRENFLMGKVPVDTFLTLYEEVSVGWEETYHE